MKMRLFSTKADNRSAGTFYQVLADEEYFCTCNYLHDAERIAAALQALEAFSTESIRSGEAVKAIKSGLLR